jgi:hypothetical protein
MWQVAHPELQVSDAVSKLPGMFDIHKRPEPLLESCKGGVGSD